MVQGTGGERDRRGLRDHRPARDRRGLPPGRRGLCDRGL